MTHRQSSTKAPRLPENDFERHPSGIFRKGTLLAVEPPGQFLVDYPGNPEGPVYAEAHVPVRPDNQGSAVILWFENAAALQPHIIGVKQNALSGPDTSSTPLKAVRKDGRLVIQAEEEIEIVCGKSSFIMKEDGTILIRGTHLTSRASGSNQIEGAIVRLN